MSLGRRRVELVSDDESESLLSRDERVNVGDVEVYHAPRLNFGQRLLGGVISFTTNVSAATVGTVVFRDALGANAGVPGDYAFTTMGLIVGDRFIRSMNAFTKESRPLAYMRVHGNGYVCNGFQNEMGRMVVATLPGLAITIPASYCRQMLFETAMMDPANNLSLLLALNFLETSAVRSLVLGTVSLGTFFATLKLLDKCVAPRPDVAPEEQPRLIWIQNVGAVAWETFKTLLIYEAVRELMHTDTGPVEVFQTEYALWAAPVLAMMMQGLSHLAERPRPFVNINPDHVPNCGGEPRVEVLDEDEEPLVESDRELSRPKDPGKCRQCGNAALKLVIALGVVTSVIVSAHKILAVTNGQQSDEQNNMLAGNSTVNNSTTYAPTSGPLVPSVVDPNAWEMPVRIGVEAAMIGAYYFLTGAVDLGMTLLNRAGNWCSNRGLFGRRQHDENQRQQEERVDNTATSSKVFDV